MAKANAGSSSKDAVVRAMAAVEAMSILQANLSRLLYLKSKKDLEDAQSRLDDLSTSVAIAKNKIDAAGESLKLKLGKSAPIQTFNLRKM